MDRTAGQGRGVQATWNYTLGAIVFFIVVYDVMLTMLALGAYGRSGSPLDAAIVVLILASMAAQVRYCWFLRAGLGGGLPQPGWTVALFAPAVLAWLVGPFSDLSGVLAAQPLWVAISIMSSLLRARGRWLVILAGAALTVAHFGLTAVLAGSPFAVIGASRGWTLIVFAVVLPIMVYTSLWWWRIVVELDRHRRSAAELAVVRERLRFASDLHDIQGHHLQVIALKSELAERTLEADPGAARENVHEIRVIAREALEETRSLVAGYRQVALEDELENAREVLTAAGARCELELGDLPENAEVRRVLGLVVREATTNILRHSGAARVRIRLTASDDDWWLEIGNDGVDSARRTGADAGTGLPGMRERITALGGALQTRIDDGWFELRTRIPAAAASGDQAVPAERTAP